MDSIATQAAQIVSPSAGGIAFGNASRDFDGVNDYIDLGSPIIPADGAAHDLTVAFWFNIDSAADEIFLSQYNAASGVRSVFRVLSNSLTFWKGGTTYLTHTLSPSTSQWYHACFTFEATGALKLYVDGVEVDTGTSTASWSSISTKIGAFTGTSPSYCDGRICDVRIYGRTISASEAADLAAGTDISSSNLLGWWLVNTDDVLDYSGNGNDGTNNGSTYSTDGPLDL